MAREYNSFTFGGIRSLDFGITLESPPDIPFPARKQTRKDVPGRSGSYLIDNGGFEDITISYPVNFKRPRFGDVERMARELKAWLLASTGVQDLEDSYDPLYFRRGSCDGGDSLTNLANHGGRGTIKFTCNPLKFLKSGQQTLVLDVQGIINNPESLKSLPYLKVYGNGAGNLYINNQTVAFSSIAGYTEIDSDLMQAFKDTAGKNNTVSLSDSKWPAFNPGENIIQWDGGITKLDYIGRWNTL